MGLRRAFPGSSGGIARVVKPYYFTDFNLTESSLSEGGAWRGGLDVGLDWKNIETQNGIAIASAFNDPPPYDDSQSILSGFPASHYVELRLFLDTGYAPGVSHEVEALLGWTLEAHVSKGIEVTYGITTTEIVVVWWKGAVNDFEVIHQLEAGGFADNDVMRATLSGDTIQHHKNGALVGTTTGIAALGLPPGNPGVGGWARAGATRNRFGAQHLKAGV